VSEQLHRLEETVDAIQEKLARLETRIARLESGPPVVESDLPPVSDRPTPQPGSKADESEGPLAAFAGTPTLIGRSLLILAGAFLLRALTERGTFEPAVGVVAGVIYAAVWIVAAAAAARNGARGKAGFYAACSAVIVGPLLLEAVTSFKVVTPATGVITLAVMTGAGLFVAARWRMQWNAWIFCVFGIVTAAAVATMDPPGESATAFLVLLGAAILWLADERGWGFLKWTTAFVGDLAVLRLTAIAVAPGSRPESFGPVHAPVVALLQAVLVAAYVGAAVLGAVRGRRPLSVFTFVQTTLALLIGWGGWFQLARVHGWEMLGAWLVAVAAGIAAYCGAFWLVDRVHGRNRAFYYLSSLGLVLVVAGLLGLAGPVSAAVLSFVAVAVALVGSRWDRVTLRVHAAILLVAAWVVSSVGRGVFEALAGRTHQLEGLVDIFIVAVLTVGVTAIVVIGSRGHTHGWVERLPLAGLLAMSALIAASGVARGVESVLGRGTVGVAGTVALSGVTVGVAFLASRAGIAEAGWLVYPFLAVTGVQMIAVDLSSGNTVVLMVALAAYGTALIVSTRLIRGARTHPVAD
jgi:hypothetical protein